MRKDDSNQLMEYTKVINEIIFLAFQTRAGYTQSNAPPLMKHFPLTDQVSFETLEKLSSDVIEASQTGALAEKLNLDLAVLEVEEPEPEPVDPLGGKKATNESGKWSGVLVGVLPTFLVEILVSRQ